MDDADDAKAIDQASERSDRLFAIDRNRVVAALAGGAVLMLAIDLTLQTIDEIVGSDNLIWEQVVRLFDLNAESSVPTWYSVILLFSASLITLVIALSRRRADDPFSRHWFLFSLLVLAFSIDEAAQIHDSPSREPLRDILGTDGLLYYPWIIAAVLGAAVLGLLSFRFLRYLPRRTTFVLLLSAAVFFGGAVVLEALGGLRLSQSEGGADLVSKTLASLEEFFELSGAVILIYALLDYAAGSLVWSQILWDGERGDAGR